MPGKLQPRLATSSLAMSSHASQGKPCHATLCPTMQPLIAKAWTAMDQKTCLPDQKTTTRPRLRTRCTLCYRFAKKQAAD